MNKKIAVVRLIGVTCLAAIILTGCFGTDRHLGTQEELESRLSECSFAEAVYNHVDERDASNARVYFRDSLSVCVYIDDDASEKQIEEVNAFLMFLRDLSICENEFHDGEYVMRFSICVRWVESGSDVYSALLTVDSTSQATRLTRRLMSACTGVENRMVAPLLLRKKFRLDWLLHKD